VNEKDVLKKLNVDSLGDLSRLPKDELQKRMAAALEGADKEKLGNMMSGMDVKKIKEKLGDVDPAMMAKIIENIKGMDSRILERIKKAITGRGE